MYSEKLQKLFSVQRISEKKLFRTIRIFKKRWPTTGENIRSYFYVIIAEAEIFTYYIIIYIYISVIWKTYLEEENGPTYYVCK